MASWGTDRSQTNVKKTLIKIRTEEIDRRFRDLEERTKILDAMYDALLDRASNLEQLIDEHIEKIKIEKKIAILSGLLLDVTDGRSRGVYNHVTAFFKQIIALAKSNKVKTVEGLLESIQNFKNDEKFCRILSAMKFPNRQWVDVKLIMEVIRRAESGNSEDVPWSDENEIPNAPPNSPEEAENRTTELLLYIDLSDDLDLNLKDTLQRMVAIAAKNKKFLPI